MHLINKTLNITKTRKLLTQVNNPVLCIRYYKDCSLHSRVFQCFRGFL